MSCGIAASPGLMEEIHVNGPNQMVSPSPQWMKTRGSVAADLALLR